jgi:hypothetical protein
MQFMEQRWGARFRLNTPAELRAPEVLPGDARVRDVSLSGAFVETAARLPMHARVSVRPLCRPGQWVDGSVVRNESTGMAVKWLEPGLRPVSTLMPARRFSASEGHDGTGAHQLVHRVTRHAGAVLRRALVLARVAGALLVRLGSARRRPEDAGTQVVAELLAP